MGLPTTSLLLLATEGETKLSIDDDDDDNDDDDGEYCGNIDDDISDGDAEVDNDDGDDEDDQEQWITRNLNRFQGFKVSRINHLMMMMMRMMMMMMMTIKARWLGVAGSHCWAAFRAVTKMHNGH